MEFLPRDPAAHRIIEGYVIAPLAERMLAADPALKREFEAKLKRTRNSPPTVKRARCSTNARYYDARFLLYRRPRTQPLELYGLGPHQPSPPPGTQSGTLVGGRAGVRAGTALHNQMRGG